LVLPLVFDASARKNPRKGTELAEGSFPLVLHPRPVFDDAQAESRGRAAGPVLPLLFVSSPRKNPRNGTEIAEGSFPLLSAPPRRRVPQLQQPGLGVGEAAPRPITRTPESRGRVSEEPQPKPPPSFRRCSRAETRGRAAAQALPLLSDPSPRKNPRKGTELAERSFPLVSASAQSLPLVPAPPRSLSPSFCVGPEPSPSFCVAPEPSPSFCTAPQPSPSFCTTRSPPPP